MLNDADHFVLAECVVVTRVDLNIMTFKKITASGCPEPFVKTDAVTKRFSEKIRR